MSISLSVPLHFVFYTCRDHSVMIGNEISVHALYSIKKRDVKPSHMGVRLHLKKMTTGRSVSEAMDIVYSVYKDHIPYMALNGPLTGIVLAVDSALLCYSKVGPESVLVLDYGDSRLGPQQLSSSPLEGETKFKALYIGVRYGTLSVQLFMGLVAFMTTAMTDTVIHSIHAQMAKKKYPIPSPPVVVMDGALTLLQSVILEFTPYKETSDYMVLTMRSIFDEFHTGAVTNPLVLSKPCTFILRCYFHFKQQIIRHFRSSKTFKCPSELRKKYQLLSELLFDSFYCGRTIKEVIGTMVSIYSLLRSKTICVMRGEATWKVNWDINSECLAHICWGDKDVQKHVEDTIIQGRSVAELTTLFAVSIENNDDGEPQLLFDASTAKQENINLQIRYNKTATINKIEQTHRRHKVRFPVVGFKEGEVESGADVENSFYSEAIADYFLQHVFKWWLLICEAAKRERYYNNQM